MRHWQEGRASRLLRTGSLGCPAESAPDCTQYAPRRPIPSYTQDAEDSFTEEILPSNIGKITSNSEEVKEGIGRFFGDIFIRRVVTPMWGAPKWFSFKWYQRRHLMMRDWLEAAASVLHMRKENGVRTSLSHVYSHLINGEVAVLHNGGDVRRPGMSYR